MQEEKKYRFYKWDEVAFILPDEYTIEDSSDLADALRVFYSVGGYDFFNVVDPRYYAANWLNFIGNLYEEIMVGKYVSAGKHYTIPLNEAQKQELTRRGVCKVFVTDI